MREEPFHIPYVGSLSPKLRLARLVDGGNVLQRQIEGIVEDIHNNRPVAASLRVPVNGCRSYRQIDLREGERPPEGAPKAKIVMKAFVSWDHQNDRWHIFVEFADEDYWEKAFGPEVDDDERPTDPSN